MKTQLYLFRSARVLALGSIIGLVGCTHAPTRTATRPLSGYTDLTNVIPPAVLTTVAPNHPYEFRRAGVSGSVEIECLVGVDGTPRNVRAKKATEPLFIRPAVKAVERWTFAPAMRDGSPIETEVNIPVHFTLLP